MDECRLKKIHDQLKIKYGSFQEELPEQILVSKFLTGSESVLEIGGNIGRNSLVIAYILNKYGNNKFVSIECDSETAEKLKENRQINNLDFQIETRALSKRKLAQKNWQTIPYTTMIPDGYSIVRTITFYELLAKYKIKFDTLILDCEGAFYFILKDFPEILDNIRMIIMENDYFDISKKSEIDKTLIERGFRSEYREHGGWGPCYYFFYEVWCVRGFNLRFVTPVCVENVQINDEKTCKETEKQEEFICQTKVNHEPVYKEPMTKSFKIHIQPKPGLNKPETTISNVLFVKTPTFHETSIPLKHVKTDSWRDLIQSQKYTQQQFGLIRPL
jgi:FkbM family methyltransferase